MIAHQSWPSLLFDGERWVLRLKTHPRPGICPVHQCRHEVPEHRPGPCAKCRKRRSRLNNPWAARWNAIKWRASQRSQEFCISVAQLKAAVIEAGMLGAFLKRPGDVHIDRKNPLIGYEPGNIQAMHWSEKLAKAQEDKRIHQEAREQEQYWECPF